MTYAPATSNEDLSPGAPSSLLSSARIFLFFLFSPPLFSFREPGLVYKLLFHAYEFTLSRIIDIFKKNPLAFPFVYYACSSFRFLFVKFNFRLVHTRVRK